MKRKLFFWIDRLHIRRSERIAVVILMLLLLTLSSLAYFVEQTSNVNSQQYADLEREFRQRSSLQKQEHEAIMARYRPQENNSQTEKLPDKSKMKENVKTVESGELAVEIADTTHININTANAEELQKLPGIGPAYSKRIVEWRNTNGKFTDVDQLLEVRGIGPVRLEKIKAFIEL